MGRVLVLIALVVAAVWLIRRALRPKPPHAGKADGAPGTAVSGELVACAHCGLNLPRGEALPAGVELYCSEDHARKGPAPRQPR